MLFEVVVPPRADPALIWQPPQTATPRAARHPASRGRLAGLLLIGGLLAGVLGISRRAGDPVDSSAISPVAEAEQVAADEPKRESVASPATLSAPPEPLTEESLYSLIGEIDRIAEFGEPDDLRPWIDEQVQFLVDLRGSGGYHELADGRVGLVAHWMGRRAAEGTSGVHVEESSTVESVEVDAAGASGEIVRRGRSTLEIEGLAVPQRADPGSRDRAEKVLERASVRCAYRERIRVGRQGGRARVLAVKLVGSCEQGG